MPGKGILVVVRRTSQADLLHVFTAGQISTPLISSECVELRHRATAAYERLSSLHFDQAPVVDRGHVVGWVLTRNLSAAPTVKAVLKRLELSAIVSKEASIADVLQLLAKDGLVFTVDEGGIHGFVTPSDLERHAARSHFYLLIAGIEMLLAQIVRERVSSSSVVARLQGESRERWEADLAGDNETDPSEYLYLRDLAELFMELPDSKSEGCWDSRLRTILTEVCQFRPTVMHPSRSLLKGRSAAQLASIARGAEQLTSRLEEISASSAPQSPAQGVPLT